MKTLYRYSTRKNFLISSLSYLSGQKLDMRTYASKNIRRIYWPMIESSFGIKPFNVIGLREAMLSIYYNSIKNTIPFSDLGKSPILRNKPVLVPAPWLGGAK